jgi:hypothetical protein
MRLRVEQSSVGILQKCLSVRPVIRVHADADARRDAQILVLDAVWCSQCSEYFVGAEGRVIWAGHFREQNHEFIPTVTADGVRRAHASYQAS